MNSLALELIDMIVDAAADSCEGKARRELLSNMSLTCRGMLPQARVHLFKNITFYENSGFGGLNGWCDYRRKRNQNNAAIVLIPPVPAAVVKKITYIGLKNDDAPCDDANEYLKKFTKVVKLVVAKRSDDVAEDIKLEPVVGKALGHQIRFLRLGWYKLDVNDLVSYLSLFSSLRCLETDGTLIKPGTLRGNPSLPEFKGVLRLDSSWYHPPTPTHEFVEMLTSIRTDMKYSHIILGSRTVRWLRAQDFPRPSLLKSRRTLVYLDISSQSQFDPILGEWNGVNLTGLNQLQKVAVHSHCPASAWEVIQSLPLDRISLLLVVPPVFLDPSGRYSLAWTSLDQKLASHCLTRRGVDNPLHFYVVSNLGYDNAHKNWPALLPDFTGRADVRVDRSLSEGPHYLGTFDRL